MLSQSVADQALSVGVALIRYDERDIAVVSVLRDREIAAGSKRLDVAD